MIFNKDDELINTPELIRKLSSQAGVKDKSSVSFEYSLSICLVTSIIIAIFVVAGLSGIRPDLSEIMTEWAFLYKIVGMTFLVISSVLLLHAAGTPGKLANPSLALLPSILFLLVGLIQSNTDLLLLGAQPLSVAICVGSIVVASLPSLVLILFGLRRGIPTRLKSAGAIAGALSGSLSGLAYTIACTNDDALFVAVWYLIAISITALLGAVVGRYVLAW